MNTGRRDFLRLIANGFVALAVGQIIGQALSATVVRDRELTEEEKLRIITKLLSTPEGKARLAASMQIPKRCGGLDYINGQPYYRYGGKLYTPEEFDKL